MKRFNILVFFSFIFMGLVSSIQADERPNILLILADDLGYADLSVQGAKQFKTPAIDSIAKNGILFTEGYVSNSVCAPSRAGLLSGRIGIGFEANLPHKTAHGLDPKVKTMAKALQQSGYATYGIGKWHLGEKKHHHPNERGFDHFFGLISGSRSYFAEKKVPWDRALQRNGKTLPEKPGMFITDRLTIEALSYLKKHSHPKSKPFFMYLSYTAPHGPLEAKKEDLAKLKHIKDERRRKYAGLVVNMDQNVARVLNLLKKNKKLKNTLIVFLSDNGGPTGQRDAASNGVLKSGKGSVNEGGVRVPFFVQWAGKIQAGQVSDEAVSSLDLFPTFTAVAKAKNPKYLDGLDLMPLMTGEVNKLKKRAIIWRRGNKKNCGYRLGKYKWMMNRNSGQESLYNIEKDPSERKNLIKQYPEIAARLKKQFVMWEGRVPEPAFESGWKPKKK